MDDEDKTWNKVPIRVGARTEPRRGDSATALRYILPSCINHKAKQQKIPKASKQAPNQPTSQVLKGEAFLGRCIFWEQSGRFLGSSWAEGWLNKYQVFWRTPASQEMELVPAFFSHFLLSSCFLNVANRKRTLVPRLWGLSPVSSDWSEEGKSSSLLPLFVSSCSCPANCQHSAFPALSEETAAH